MNVQQAVQHAPDWATAMAKDENGEWYYYEKIDPKPWSLTWRWGCSSRIKEICKSHRPKTNHRWNKYYYAIEQD